MAEDPLDLTRAAGAVVWRGAADDPQVVLIHRPRYDDWTLPKGKLGPGEHVLLAAVREVHEETGLEVVLGRPLPAAGYLKDGRPKRVDYWVAAVSTDHGFDPSDEVDELAWFPVGAALDRLSYPRDSGTLLDFTGTRPDSVPLIFLRHARAGDRRRWSGADRDRPLDPAGEEQAAKLADLLGCFGPSRIISSPATRCVQTVEWYADLIDADIEISKALAAPDQVTDQAAGDPRQLVLDAIEQGAPAVFCGHGETLPGLVAWLCGYLGAAPPADPWLAKAEFDVLHLLGGKLVGAERHSPT